MNDSQERLPNLYFLLKLRGDYPALVSVTSAQLTEETAARSMEKSRSMSVKDQKVSVL